MLTAERLHDLLNYDPHTGVFCWRVNRGPAKAGVKTGCPDGKGHLRITVDNVVYSAHRLAWLYVHGRWPKDQIDHKNGVRHDNRIANLREATKSQNHHNSKRPRNNTSGHKGVYWHAKSRKWMALISVNGRSNYLGLYDTREAAAAARRTAADRLHGAFARYA